MNTQSKSPADSTEASDDVWGALNEIYLNCAAYTLVPASVAPFIRNKELVAKVPDQAELLRTVQMLERDVPEYSERLKAIHATHAERTGPTSDSNDLIRALKTREKYEDWSESYESVVVPTVETILDMFSRAGVDTTNKVDPLHDVQEIRKDLEAASGLPLEAANAIAPNAARITKENYPLQDVDNLKDIETDNAATTETPND